MNTYLLLLPFFFLVLIYKNRNNNLALLPLGFYCVGAIVGYFMTFNPVYPDSVNAGHQAPSLLANLFLMVCLLIAFLPILKSRIIDTYNIVISKNGLYFFSLFLMLLSLFYIVWMAPHITEALAATADFGTYKSDISAEGMTFSRGIPLVGWILAVQVALRPIVIFLFCLTLSNKKYSSKYRMIMGFIAIVPPIIQAFATAYRNELVFTGVNFFVCYLFFKCYFSERVKKTFLLTILGGGGLLVLVIVVLFAILRFGENGNEYIVFSLERYYGEPFVNFNTMLWGEKNLLWGNKCFVVLRKFLGMSYIEPGNLEDYECLWDYQYNFFYCFIGDYYQDFGPFGTVLTCAIITLIVRMIQRQCSQKSLFLSLNLMNYLYTTVIIRSYFYFVYSGYNLLSLVFLLMGFLYCHLFIFNSPEKVLNSTNHNT